MCFYQLDFENARKEVYFEEKDVMAGLLKWFVPTGFFEKDR